MAEFVDVMPDREKVIRALECCLDINSSKYKHCLNCDYRHDIDHCQWACQTDGILEDALALLKAQEPVVPHRNYQYLSDYWCECGWHLGRGGSVKYCPECGRAVKWDG